MITLGFSSISPEDGYLARLSPGSRRTQGSALRTLHGILGAEVDWRAFTREDYVRTRSILIGRGLAPTTINRLLSAVKGVLLEADNPLLRLSGVRGERLPAGRVLTEAEVLRLSGGCGAGDIGIRNRAMLAALVGCGLRRSEACALRPSDYRVEGLLRVQGKGNKHRMVPVPKEFRRSLNDAAVRFAWLIPRFTSQGVATQEPITPEGMVYILRKIRRRSGVEPFSPHDIRRTYITGLLRQGIDPMLVAKAVGHSRLDTTLKYDRRSTDDLAAAIDALPERGVLLS